MPTFLSEKTLSGFERDGFVVARGLFSAENVGLIEAWTDELESAPEIPGNSMKYYEESLLESGRRILQRIENFYPYHEGFRNLLDGELRDIISQLFGEPAVLFKDKINLKKPGGSGFKPHQDQQAGWGVYAKLFITAMVSIDASDDRNGCLALAAGHHRRGLIGKEWEPLGGAELSGMSFVPYPTAPGDVLLFDSYAPHGSEPNLTARSRRILYVTYNRLSEGDHRERYFADKRRAFPPDIEREPGKTYVFRV